MGPFSVHEGTSYVAAWIDLYELKSREREIQSRSRPSPLRLRRKLQLMRCYLSRAASSLWGRYLPERVISYHLSMTVVPKESA